MCLEPSAEGNQNRGSATHLSSSPLSGNKNNEEKERRFKNKRGIFLKLSLLMILSIIVACGTLSIGFPGFGRSLQFWSAIGPLLIKYRYLTFICRFRAYSEIDKQSLIKTFHLQTAPKVVSIMLRLGGIYVKIGQVMSTVGATFMDEAYVAALRPLQDGVPPRSHEEVASIIEKSVGRTMAELFINFEEIPVGAASIGQAHRATLADGKHTQVIVKVQYPEVAALFRADFINLEMVTRLLAPENLATMKNLRSRHEKELDYRVEAAHLRECGENMERHGLQPSLVRIPRVMGHSGLLTKDVLVMEYLEGVSLADAIQEEQAEIAYALGMSKEKTKNTIKDLLFESTGRKSDSLDYEGRIGTVGEIQSVKQSGSSLQLLGRRRIVSLGGATLRTFAKIKRQLVRVKHGALASSSNLVRGLTLGMVRPTVRTLDTPPRRRHESVNLQRAIKSLVYVHGVQLLMDGCFNADPHPGNVLVLKDGRLGLVDYGMIGRLSFSHRLSVANTILGLANRDKRRVANIYSDSGYKISWRKTGEPHGDEAIYRCATLHLDQFDLSPVQVTPNGESMPLLKFLDQVKEEHTPEWIEQSRRLAALLIGVALQAARPISLATQWAPLATKVVRLSEKKSID